MSPSSHSPDQLVQTVLDKWNGGPDGNTPPTPHEIATILRAEHIYVGDAAILQVHDIVKVRDARDWHPPQADTPLPQANLHALVQAARDLKSEDGENPEYDRALVELVANASGYGDESHREVMRHLVLGSPREFEIRGRIVIDYAMGFSEAEARQWFPKAGWHLEPNTSVAGNIETDCLDSAPAEFWHFVNLKRDVVLDLEAKPQHLYELRNEITGVVEL